ncbi:hypothetical protein Btru_047362 [Bulinus truncatus]|nr:hypothetical protein Btru_047362 [Bulinus truncatus]
MCVNKAGGYECPCLNGMVRNSTGQCEAKSPCTPMIPCSGVCVAIPTSEQPMVTCLCPRGMKLDPLDQVTCTECSHWTYGLNCGQHCDCNVSNAMSCDRVTGECLCHPNWTSSHCSDDVDECLMQPPPCGNNAVCENTPGSYECLCGQGFEKFNDTHCDECGITLTEESGRIISVRHDGHLDADLDECWWTISAPEGHVITVRFERFELFYSDEFHIKPGSVEIYDGDSRDSELLATFYGKPSDCVPDDLIRSSGNKLFIARISASNFDGCGFPTDGFDLNYWIHICEPFTYDENCTSLCNCVQSNSVGCDSLTGQCICQPGWDSFDCSVDIDECQDDHLLCPEYSLCYNTNSSYICVCKEGLVMNELDECVVMPNATCITRQCSHLCVQLIYQNPTQPVDVCYCPIGMELDGDNCTGEDCSIDYDVCSEEGSNEECQEHAVCVNTGLSGFRCRCCQQDGYTESENGTCVPVASHCGGHLHDQTGIIYSPNFPFPYSDNLTCFWSITVEENQVIDLRFSHLDLDRYWNQNCKDFVVIYDGPSSASPIIGPVYCGYSNEFQIFDIQIRSKSNKLYIMFKSDETFSGFGFSATYWAHVCPDFKYGEAICNTTCECDLTNSERCDSQTGACTCHDGWGSENCTEDINECLKYDVCPDLYTRCVNTPGSYECQCFDGMVKSTSGICEAAIKCKSSSCSGTCVVYPNDMSTDICKCPKGTKRDLLNTSKCVECDDWFYGENCQLQCNCNVTNANSCDKVTGQCLCYDNWTSSTCSEDVDECSLDDPPCADYDNNAMCINTAGSYKCVCLQGFEIFNSTYCYECGRTLNETSGRITSLRYLDLMSADYDECCWTIVAPVGWVISVRFERFQLFYSDEFPNKPGSVEIYDGSSCNSTLLAKFYGKPDDHVPDDVIKSSGNHMFIGRVPASDFSHRGLPTDGFDLIYWSYACAPFTYGVNCSSVCSCVQPNTEYCDSVTGQCTCIDGWTSSDCSVDIDECYVDPLICPDYALCVNNNGSYECSCKEGLSLNELRYCNVMKNMTCTKKQCSHMCVQQLISTNSAESREVCYCPNGMTLDGDQCVACSSNTFGPDCSRQCNCVQNHTQSCDSRTGECTCLPSWKGEDCSIDYDVCSEEGSNEECQEHAVCVNRCEAGFRCRCLEQDGYTESDNGTCIPIYCGGQFTNSTGEFLSPNFPYPYPEKITCFWSITVEEDQIIDLRFRHLDLDRYQNHSCKDYIIVYDGAGTDSPIIETAFCGFRDQIDILRILIRSTSNKLSILFKSDEDVSGSGFHAIYWAHECPPFTYGEENCTSACECDMSHTECCNSIDGTCQCRIGWTSSCCSEDIDECQNTTLCPDLYSTCVNTLGGYECQCFSGMAKDSLGHCGASKNCDLNKCSGMCVASSANSTDEICYCPRGKKLDSLDRTLCVDCDDWSFGENCQHWSKCNVTNTQWYDRVTGECHCYPNWTSSTCDVDVDECSSDPPACTISEDNSICFNQAGSFKCVCLHGFEDFNATHCEACGRTLTEPNGTIVSNGHYGLLKELFDECHWTIIAPPGHTISLMFKRFQLYHSSYHGMRPGSLEIYDGDSCNATLLAKIYGRWDNAVPIDVITSSGNKMHIIRLPASRRHVYGYVTKGFEAYYWTKACDGSSVCTPSCNCVPDNTANCDLNTHRCICKVGWTLPDCSGDVNECLDSGVSCPDLSECHNTDGNYTCVCRNGLHMNGSYQCEYVSSSFSVTLVFDVDVSKKNLEDKNSEDYNRIRLEIENQLYTKLKQKLKSVSRVAVTKLRKGSLVVDCNVTLDGSLQNNSYTDLLSALRQISSEQFVTDSQIIMITSLLINGMNVDVDACVIRQSFKPCKDGEQCFVEGDSTVCRAKRTNSDRSLVLGLAIGLSLFTALCLAIIIGAYCLQRKRNDKRSKHSNGHSSSTYRKPSFADLETDNLYESTAKFHKFDFEDYSALEQKDNHGYSNSEFDNDKTTDDTEGLSSRL